MYNLKTKFPPISEYLACNWQSADLIHATKRLGDLGLRGHYFLNLKFNALFKEKENSVVIKNNKIRLALFLALTLFASSSSFASYIDVSVSIRGGGEERNGVYGRLFVDHYNVNYYPYSEDPDSEDLTSYVELRGMLEFDVTLFPSRFSHVSLISPIAQEGCGCDLYLQLFGYSGDGQLTESDFYRDDTPLIESKLKQTTTGQIIDFDVTEFIRSVALNETSFAGFNLRDPTRDFIGAWYGTNEVLRFYTVPVPSPITMLIPALASILIFRRVKRTRIIRPVKYL